jgi:ketosteroid isomerase-like protein
MPARLPALFTAIDARDAQAFANFLSPNVTFIFANAPALHGREQAQAAVAGFFASLAGLRHELAEHWQCGESLIMRGQVTYTRHDGSQLCLPFANIFKLRDNLINEYRIYGDFSALVA